MSGVHGVKRAHHVNDHFRNVKIGLVMSIQTQISSMAPLEFSSRGWEEHQLFPLQWMKTNEKKNTLHNINYLVIHKRTISFTKVIFCNRYRLELRILKQANVCNNMTTNVIPLEHWKCVIQPCWKINETVK